MQITTQKPTRDFIWQEIGSVLKATSKSAELASVHTLVFFTLQWTAVKSNHKNSFSYEKLRKNSFSYEKLRKNSFSYEKFFYQKWEQK